jgi:hypothetical protein
METLAIASKEVRTIFPAKIGQPGSHPGSAEPEGRLNTNGAPSSLPSLAGWHVGPDGDPW